MTSDAKVGLLLGLVFIVVIAFLINGLPDLLGNVSSREVISTSVTDSNANFGLSDQARDAIRMVRDYKPLNIPKRPIPINNDAFVDERFTTGISTGYGNRKNNISSDNIRVASHGKYYVVRSGDNLGKIAIAAYGREIGNKYDTVENLINANSGILESPDDIYVGQKLIIPLVGQSDTIRVVRSSGNNSGMASGSGMFDKVSKAIKNVLRKPADRTSYQKFYVVRDGDSLWQIASDRLGSGSRYKEILRMNDHILESADDLSVGMKLEMPRK